ncbi:MAG TPA: helix-turn-helix domain-containing protein [Solirubrobacteraceae bacterium]|nr:helix-turn-helix domain-containing protein [Solirubrobacteraceae bacterium]
MTEANPCERPARLLTVEEVAERWQVAASQVYALVRAGKVPTVSIGRYYRFRLEDLEGWERRGGTEEIYSERRD